MVTRIIAIYSMFLGVSVIGMWLMILNTQTIPEGQTELGFHLFSEFLMATLCLVSGFLLLKNKTIAVPLNFIGLAMVIYSVLNAAGYYGERGETPMMVMFTVLFLLTTAALFLLLKSRFVS